MTNFIGTEGDDSANAATGEIVGFTGGNQADLQDGTGDFFAGGGGEDFIFAGDANDLIEGGEGHDLLADLDKNGVFETGIILAGAGAAADFGFADIV